jgi:hypothetical protein
MWLDQDSALREIHCPPVVLSADLAVNLTCRVLLDIFQGMVMYTLCGGRRSQSVHCCFVAWRSKAQAVR